jgi:hypothetical protein
MIFMLALGTMLFHAVTGTALIVTIVGSWILLTLFGKRFAGGGELPGRGFAPLGAAILAAAFGLPYVMSLGGGAEGGGNVFAEYLNIGVKGILTILFPVLVLFSPVRAAVRDLLSKRDYRSAVMISWAVSLLALAVFVNLPTVNESKLIFPLFLVIGPPIYVELGRKIGGSEGLKKALLAAAAVILFAVPPVMTFRGFILQKPEDDFTIRRENITSDDRDFFEWVRENTDGEAIVMENNIDHLVPVYAGRRNFYSTQGVILMLGYDPETMSRYERIQSSVYGREEIPEDVLRSMRDFGREIFVAVWRDDMESRPWLEKRFSAESGIFSRVYGNDSVSLYALRPAGD